MGSIYIRLIDSKSGAITTTGTTDSTVFPLTEAFDPKKASQFLKVLSYSSGVEQTLNLGSQSSGAGAGKINFNPFIIEKVNDALSPLLFQSAATGTAFKTADVLFVNNANYITVRHTYKLVAVKTISWAASTDDSDVREMVAFEYGGLIITINQQGADGKFGRVLQSGWNRVKNIKDVDLVGALM